MSSMISGFLPSASGYDTLQQLVFNAGVTKAKLDQLTAQASSGYAGGTYASVDIAKTPAAGSNALSLAPQIAAIKTQTADINAAVGRMDVQQTALSSISSIVSGVTSQLQSASPVTSQSVPIVAQQAKQALTQVANLLDSTYAGIYVFGGQASSTPPVPDPNNIASSNFSTAIMSAVSNLATSGAAATSAATLSIAKSNAPGVTPFAGSLGPTPSLPLADRGNGTTVTVGIAANTNAFVPSSGSDTTGSYMRDILRGLATIAGLGSVSASSPQFASFAQSTVQALNGAITSLNQDAGVLGNTQASLTRQQQALAQTNTALSTQLANADQVDMAQTLSALSATQTALQASYQLIAAQKTLSLTQYV